jgi:prepilin-type N-terminal cleavage/methylation domain-containing protein
MKRRQGFTLVELLVAMALIVFIMSILSAAFVSATQVFRDLKALGDMAEKLRTASNVLRRDLAADHFDGKRRLGQPTFWNQDQPVDPPNTTTTNVPTPTSGPPPQGYFRIWQGSPLVQPPAPANSAYISELSDLDGIISNRAVDHMLSFTVKLRGNQSSDLFSASVPPGFTIFGGATAQDAVYQQNPLLYNYPWAEVVYFLRPQINPQTNAQDQAADPANPLNTTPLFSLYRRQFLAVPDNAQVPNPPTNPPSTGWATATYASQFPEVSCKDDPLNVGTLYFNNPADLTMPGRRRGLDAKTGLPTFVDPYLKTQGVIRLTYPTMQEEGVAQPQQGTDLLLTDVLSFEVRMLFADPNPTSGTANVTPLTTDPKNPFIDLYDSTLSGKFPNTNGTLFGANGPRVFDTWSSMSSPNQNALTDYSTWRAGTFPNSQIPMWSTALNTGPIIKAIQVTIRVWDAKTLQTRQVTIVQAM